MSDIARFPVYDLHSHTRASDGLLTPAALVQRAVEMRVGVLAITDHDSVAGVDEAQQTAIDYDLPIKVLAGAEISTLWENHEIHIVGLNIDIRHPAMVAFLAGQHACRQARAEEIGE
ncbi:PHP domain-containing protein, partial [Pantoea agglomerans]|nr:PHP domain-containing protein [Pantoea agglomerans]